MKLGYFYITAPDGRRMRRARYNMEKYLGRRLTPKEVVHHIDEDKLNDSIENLQLCANNGSHRALHYKYYRDDIKKQCSKCKAIKPRIDFVKSSGRPFGDPHRSICRQCSSALCRENYLRRKADARD